MEHTITPQELFNTWCTHEDEPWVLATRLHLTPAQLVDLSEHPDFVRRVAAWRALTRAYRDEIVFNHQSAAAAKLRETMSSDDPIEARRAATVLARLSHNMLPAGTARGGTARGGTARGGTALQSGASQPDTALQCSASDEATTPQTGPPVDPAPTQNAPESTLSIPPSTAPDPSTPNALTAPPPLPFTAPPQVITKLAALTALAGTAQAARASGP